MIPVIDKHQEPTGNDELLIRAERSSVMPRPGKISNDHDRRKLSSVLRLPTLLGLLVLTGFFGVFGTWAATAPIAGAAVATGLVSPDTNRKSIQHLEGGIVKTIKVREGSVVTAGTPLVILDDTKARATLEQQVVEASARRARVARLLTERRNLVDNTDLQDVQFPQDLLDDAKSDSNLAELIEAEKASYAARRNSLKSEIEFYEQTMLQYTAELVEMDGQLRAVQNHQSLIREEIRSIQGLLEKGYETQKRLREMMRMEAAQQEEEAAIRVKFVTSKEQIASARIKIIQLKTSRMDEVTSEIATVRAELQALREQVAASRDTLARLIIRSPVDGTVMNIKVHTLGGVIAPAGIVMDIVPTHDDLIIDAELSPNDIDVVHVGQKAVVNLTAYPTRHVPSISGTVLSVSGDVLTNSTTGTSYYLAQITVAADELARLQKQVDVSLIPGMPVEVLIMTQERTMVDYLLDPIIKSMRRSFRES